MNQVINIIKMHSKANFFWFVAPWLFACLPAFAINFFIALLLNQKAYYTGGILSVYIYMAIMSAVTLLQTFPFALGLSRRRTDYYLGTMSMLTITIGASSVAIIFFTLIEQYLIPGWGVSMHFFSLPYLSDGSIFTQFWTYFGNMLHLCLLGFVMVCVLQRFGLKGLFVFYIIALLLISVGVYLLTHNNWWGELFRLLSLHSASELTIWTIPFSSIYAIASYLMLKKATV
jgi:hypothetical protein